MGERGSDLLPQQKARMWMLLAPATEDDDLQYTADGMTEHAASMAAQTSRKSRPGTALRDSTGRRVVHGYERFHESAENGGDAMLKASGIKVRPPPAPEQRAAEGEERRDGMLHGKGVRVYEKNKKWEGTLLPYGSLMDVRAPAKTAFVVPFRRYKREPGILARFNKPIVLVHGPDAIKNVMHCAKVLEVMKFCNHQATALVLEFEHVNIQRVVFAQAKYSSLFQHFSFPVIAVSQADFEFPGKQMLWPHRSLIEARKEDLAAGGMEKKGWLMPEREDVPQELTLAPRGLHKLDEMGQFPTDIEYEKAPGCVIDWTGVEVYAGEFSHGTKNGRGVFARANGDLMCGKFLRGVAHGVCTYFRRSGNSFIGEWLNGKQVGRGESRTLEMIAKAVLLQQAFRCFLARRAVDKLHSVAQIRKNALEKAARLREQEEREMQEAVAAAKARRLELEGSESDSEAPR